VPLQIVQRRWKKQWLQVWEDLIEVLPATCQRRSGIKHARVVGEPGRDGAHEERAHGELVVPKMQVFGDGALEGRAMQKWDVEIDVLEIKIYQGGEGVRRRKHVSPFWCIYPLLPLASVQLEICSSE
jgi:hypothetical protein